MFNYIDALPDLQFMSILIVLIIVAHVASWAFDKWCGK